MAVVNQKKSRKTTASISGDLHLLKQDRVAPAPFREDLGHKLLGFFVWLAASQHRCPEVSRRLPLMQLAKPERPKPFPDQLELQHGRSLPVHQLLPGWHALQ